MQVLQRNILPIYTQRINLAFTGDELGRSVVLKKCDRTAVDDFYSNVVCTPQPDALNPCEDIVSFKPLRVAIWVSMC